MWIIRAFPLENEETIEKTKDTYCWDMLPKDLEEILEKCLKEDPAKRPTMTELEESIRTAFSNLINRDKSQISAVCAQLVAHRAAVQKKEKKREEERAKKEDSLEKSSE